MAVLDFKEIPKAHIADGMQDTFELFAREFLIFMGYEVLSHPDRGADGGKDLIVAERRSGVAGESIIKWLVSCKHKSHSNNSVTPTDEANISDRVQANDCDGFMGFYSTIASSGLTDNLEGLKSRNGTEFLIYDREWIERRLLAPDDGQELARRFFPTSFGKWERESLKPIGIVRIDVNSIYADNMIKFLDIDEYDEEKLYLRRDLKNLLIKLSNIRENLRLLLFNIISNSYIKYPDGVECYDELYVYDFMLADSIPNSEMMVEILCQEGLMYKSDQYDFLDFKGKYQYLFPCFSGEYETNIFRVMRDMYSSDSARLYNVLVGCDFSKL